MMTGIETKIETEIERYRVDNKKVNNWYFQHPLGYLEQTFFCNRFKRQRTISAQILKAFGQCQNCQYLTFKWPYQLNKSK